MRKPWAPTAHSYVIGLKRKLLYLWNLILPAPALQRPVKQTPPAAGQGDRGVGRHGPLCKGMLGVAGGGSFFCFHLWETILHASHMYLETTYSEKVCVCVCVPRGEAKCHIDGSRKATGSNSELPVLQVTSMTSSTSLEASNIARANVSFPRSPNT